MKATQRQEGGAWYKDMAIQPAVFSQKNKLNFLESCVVKRMCRWDKKSNPMLDLKKAIHEIELIIELENEDEIIQTPTGTCGLCTEEASPSVGNRDRKDPYGDQTIRDYQEKSLSRVSEELKRELAKGDKEVFPTGHVCRAD